MLKSSRLVSLLVTIIVTVISESRASDVIRFFVLLIVSQIGKYKDPYSRRKHVRFYNLYLFFVVINSLFLVNFMVYVLPSKQVCF